MPGLEETVCQTCGNKGISEALVICVKCHDAGEHRYCSPEWPKNFEDTDGWICSDCILGNAEQSISGNLFCRHPNSVQMSDSSSEIALRDTCIVSQKEIHIGKSLDTLQPCKVHQEADLGRWSPLVQNKRTSRLNMNLHEVKKSVHGKMPTSKDTCMDSVSYQPGPVDGFLLTQQSEHRSELIWHGEELADFRVRVNYRQYWDDIKNHPPPSDIVAAIRASSLDKVYQIGAFRHDSGLITAFVERWRPETHTFHFRFGEATITLEDVHHILGLPTSGVPVIQSFGSPSLADKRRMVGELLGVYPVDDDVTRGGLKITWLIEHFARCQRLDMDSENYDRELVFHIRAHLLLIIGSLFPNSTGNRIQLQLLHYVWDHTQVHTYSWGSAVLAYLYKNLCSASIGSKRGICGAMTLLQVWIWEHFPSLAPARKEDVFIQHPLTLRWKVRLSMKSVPRSQSRIVRYELDCMATDDHITWRPYRDVADDDLPGYNTQRLWTSKCPLIFNEIVEWCYTDRVTRQFGLRQDIPQLPEENHKRLHGTVNDSVDWLYIRSDYIHLWESRSTQILSPIQNPPVTKNGCTRAYGPWYDSVTRRFILNPRHWSSQQGFQGRQGRLQYYVERISQAYHTIHSSDTNVEEAQQILGDHMTSIGFSSFRHTLLPIGRRDTRRHIATGRPRGRPKGRPRDVRINPKPRTSFEKKLRGPMDLGSSDDPTSSGFMTEAPPPPLGGGWGSWT